MRIAILGATSLIARDLVDALAADAGNELFLFARRLPALTEGLARRGLAGRCHCAELADFTSALEVDALINFVGAGNPAQVAAMGTSILEVTDHHDRMALDYLRLHPHCRYLFLSSGAAYGSHFDQPANGDSPARLPLNRLQAQDWYGAAKLMAEVRHRARPELAIFDLRLFNYVSRHQDLGARFLVTDALRAIQAGEPLQVSAESLVRDYLHPQDFHRLVRALLVCPPSNGAVDAYTLAPIGKFELLEAMGREFGLRHEVAAGEQGVPATGTKAQYFSTWQAAGAHGYQPRLSSLEGVLCEARAILAGGD